MTNPAVFEFEVRIAYADTDRMGVVYYANYFTLFERGRTELMRNAGLRYRDMEENDKVFLPVSEATCRYLAPAHYDDLIVVRTKIKDLGRAHVDFEYEIFHAETKQALATGFTRHPFVNANWKPVRAPQSITSKFSS
jgi:acyl-CoA thioester hydrolase